LFIFTGVLFQIKDKTKIIQPPRKVMIAHIIRVIFAFGDIVKI